jgi:hypothetical protein
MVQHTHDIHLNDGRTPFKATLMQSGSAVNLTGLTVKFKLVAADGTVVLADTTTGVTVLVAANGTVEYDFSTLAAHSYNELFGYFIVINGIKTDHFPVKHRELRFRIHTD